MPIGARFMKKSLIIVESEAKCNTLQAILGPDFKVAACYGHIKDLPRKRLGIDISKQLTPEFEILRGKKNLLKTLQQQAQNVSTIFIATDPDREGEAIAAHLVEVLNLHHSNYRRIRFNEISAHAVRNAIQR